MEYLEWACSFISGRNETKGNDMEYLEQAHPTEGLTQQRHDPMRHLMGRIIGQAVADARECVRKGAIVDGKVTTTMTSRSCYRINVAELHEFITGGSLLRICGKMGHRWASHARHEVAELGIGGAE